MKNLMYVKSVILMSMLFISHALFAQYDDSATSEKLLTQKATAAKYAETITQEDLKKHLSVLASDEYEGRETGAKGQKMAAEYIANHFKSLGLPAIGEKKDYFQYFNLSKQTWTGDAHAIVNGKRYEFLEDLYSFSGLTPAIEEKINEVIFLGYGIDDKKYSDYKGVDVKGKTILIFAGEPKNRSGNYIISGSEETSDWTDNWRLKLETAKEKGVKLMMVVKDDIKADVEMMNYYISGRSMQLQSAKGSGRYVESIYISKDMAQNILGTRKKSQLPWLAAKITKKRKPRKAKASTNTQLSLTKEGDLIESQNVLGLIEGSDLKDEYIVLTAHYDHLGKRGDQIYNGADDDGSGTVAVLEMAEAFAKAKADGKGPRRSVLILPVSGEEKGLLGSKFYTDHDPIFPLDQTVANLNIDMVGRIDKEHDNGNYVYVIGSDKLSTELHNINEKMNKDFVNIDLDYRYNDDNDPNRFYYRSDHYNFAKNNIPIIFYFNGTHDDYHQASDTVEKIEFEALQKRAHLMFLTAWQLANQDKRIVVDKKPKKDQ